MYLWNYINLTYILAKHDLTLYRRSADCCI